MSTAVSLRDFIIDRLTAAAADIFSVCEQTIVRYEQEIDRQRRLLEISLKPRINLTRIEFEPHNEGRNRTNVDSEPDPMVHIQEEPEPEPEPPQIKEEQEELNLQTGENQECTQTEPSLLVKTEPDNSELLQATVKQEAEPTAIGEKPQPDHLNLLSHDSAENKPRRRRRSKHADSSSTVTATLTITNANHSDSETMSYTSDTDVRSLTSDTDDSSDDTPDTDCESESVSGFDDIEKNIRKISSKRLREKMDSSRKWLLCWRCEERKGFFNDHTYHKPVSELNENGVRHKDTTHSHCEICGDCLILGQRCHT